eukprot:Unigene5926_Nuclearia_a/m.18146 Unigene5926_Nuclearia_a/g.18146  ORF Unigene5926_Nuclearia_a/g.18146 Unigene5926_Nuclearia_a/m.18146 type:complete len:305 (-) Unigene5926_Nuclearia_a:16-930(-)
MVPSPLPAITSTPVSSSYSGRSTPVELSTVSRARAEPSARLSQSAISRSRDLVKPVVTMRSWSPSQHTAAALTPVCAATSCATLPVRGSITRSFWSLAVVARSTPSAFHESACTTSPWPATSRRAAPASASQSLTSAPAADAITACACGWKRSASTRRVWPVSAARDSALVARAPSPWTLQSLTVQSSDPVASSSSWNGENWRSVTGLACAPTTSASLSNLPGRPTGTTPTEPPPPELYGNATNAQLAATSDDVSAPDAATCRSVYHASALAGLPTACLYLDVAANFLDMAREGWGAKLNQLHT